MKSKKKWLEGLAALKIDMSKAYDIIECDFLRKMMIQLDFQERWVHLIMKCVTFVSYKIKINGSHTSCFIPQHGLRQGDPLPPPPSPYLFILYVHGLSALLYKAEQDGKIQGIKNCREAPNINHLFFAYDSLILMKARINDLKELKHILEVYERASGQVINKDKSSIIFSPSTRNSVRDQVKAIISIQYEVRSGKLLGLPILVGKSNKKTFEYFKKRIWSQIQGWQ
jgi:hypothetical protein